MTFTDQAQLSSSERFFLVRLQPRRYLYLGDPESEAIPLNFFYTLPQNLNINEIYINQYKLSSSDYIYNKDLNEYNLQITSPIINATDLIKGIWYKINTAGSTDFTQCGAISNDPGTSFEATKSGTGTGTVVFDLTRPENITILEHNIYITGTKFRETNNISGLPDAKWEPLIFNYPGFNQSMQNIAEGVFSLSGSSLQLISNNRWVQELIGTPEDSILPGASGQYESLSSCPVSVWVCINSASNNRKIFDGEVSSVSYQSQVVNLSIIDSFQKLNNTASFGDRSQSEIYKGNIFDTIVLSPNPTDENKKIPLTIGSSTPYKVSLGYKQVDAFGFLSTIKLYHLSDGQECTLMKEADQTEESYWLAGRIVAPLKLLTFGPIAPGSNTKILNFKKNIPGLNVIDDGTANAGESNPTTIQVVNRIVFIELDDIDNFNGEIGDFLPPEWFFAIDGEVIGAAICGYGNNLIPGQNYNLAVTLLYENGVKWDKVNLPDEQNFSAIGLTDNVQPSLSVWVEADSTATYDYEKIQYSAAPVDYLLQNKFNFTTRYLPIQSIGATQYNLVGQDIYNIYFSLPPNDKINLATSKIKCRIGVEGSINHADALKFVVKAAGMDVSEVSFSNAANDLDANVSFTIPANGNDFPSYLEVAQSITSSTLGLLRVNQQRQVEYEIIKDPAISTADSVKSSINMLNGQTSTSVNYQDLASRIEFENPQLENISALENFGPKAVVELPIAKYLHRIDKTKKIQHVLENIQSRKDAIAGYFASPTVQYSLATANEDLASSIGDIVEIQNTAVADKKQTTKGVIIALEQSGPTTSLRINEIRGVD